ncbi:MAG: hypothetical protein ACRDE2_17215, partial [Chitinophagaceae bacterium]
MGKKQKHYLFWIICAVILFEIVSIILPFTSHVEKRITIAANKNLILSKIANLKTYELWYPWLISDAKVSAGYSGISHGEGAWMRWKAGENNIKGSYLYTIIKVLSDSMIRFTFSLPDATILSGQYVLSNSTNPHQTNVIWRVDIKNKRGGWLKALFSKKNKLLGEAMNAGLINLKILAEEAPRYHGLEVEEIPLKETFVATVSDTVNKNKVFESMPDILKKIKDEMTQRQFKITGSPMVQMQSVGKDNMLLNIGVPVDHNGAASGDIQILRMPPG